MGWVSVQFEVERPGWPGIGVQEWDSEESWGDWLGFQVRKWVGVAGSRVFSWNEKDRVLGPHLNGLTWEVCAVWDI